MRGYITLSAIPRRLDSPPISEALVDLRAAVAHPPADFEAFAKEFSAEYPVVKRKAGFRAELKVEGGKLIPPTAVDLGFQGLMLLNVEETRVVQFRPDGFTFNCLKTYVGADELIADTLKLWSRFSDRMGTPTVTRIAMRYINQLHLPFQVGDDFSKYLTATPVVPEGSPQQVSAFLSQVVAHGETTTVITIQHLTTPRPDSPLVVMDIDVFREGEFAADPADLRVILEELRQVKNDTFFSLLTEDAVKLYVR